MGVLESTRKIMSRRDDKVWLPGFLTHSNFSSAQQPFSSTTTRHAGYRSRVAVLAARDCDISLVRTVLRSSGLELTRAET